jgi:hypothetical protein
MNVSASRYLRQTAAAFAIGSILLLLVASPASACLTYVVDEVRQTGPHPWRTQAVIRAEVTRVDAAGPDLIDRNPIGYELTVRRVLLGRRVPRTVEVGRAAGCDSIRLALGEDVLVAVRQGVNIGTPRGADPGYGVDNYNSAWYRLLAGGRVTLVRGSAWFAGLQGSGTLQEVLQAAQGLPSTDTRHPEGPDRAATALGFAMVFSMAFAAATLLSLRVRFRRVR